MANGHNVQPDIEIHIESVGGDLVIEGRNDNEIRARGDDLSLHIEDDGRHAVLSAGGDCRVRVPNGAHISIDSVGADARITDVSGAITISSVGADLVIRDTGEVTISNVGADLELKRIKGNALVSNVGADASFREIDGNLQVSMVGADALVTNIGGSCEMDVIGADLVLQADFKPSATYRFGTVGNEVLTRLQPDASVRFVLPHHVEREIGVREARIEEGSDTDTLILGEGAALVTFENVGGEVVLAQHDATDSEEWFENVIPENLDEIISAQINLHLSSIREKAEREAERARSKAEHEAERAREKAERIAERAKRQAEQMARQAEHNAERMRHQAQHGQPWGHGWGFDFNWGGPGEKRKRGFPTPPVPPMPPFPGMEKRKRGMDDAGQPSEPVSNEERMTILRMVENKQITVEEAERLLSALEGQD